MTASVGTVVFLTVLSIVFAVLFRVLFMLAINFDCRSRSLKTTSMFTAFALLFPLIAGIVYACVRKKGEVNKQVCTMCGAQIDGAAKQCPQCLSMTFNPILPANAENLAKTSIKLFVISVIIFVIAVGCGTARTVMAAKITNDLAENYTEEDIENAVDDILEEYSKHQAQSTTDGSSTNKKEESTSGNTETTTSVGDKLDSLTYYDRNGKAYSEQQEVPFYARDSTKYYFRMDENLQTWFVKEGSDQKLKSTQCFVDKNGYFVYDENDEFKLSDDRLVATDKKGNKYSPAAIVIWNKDGTMISSIN
ncbi:MAG: hypothetical protein IJI47_03570 [Eubacterium sp.]|nr:hypothetical protein [Eubacterium sp.]